MKRGSKEAKDQTLNRNSVGSLSNLWKEGLEGRSSAMAFGHDSLMPFGFAREVFVAANLVMRRAAKDRMTRSMMRMTMIRFERLWIAKRMAIMSFDRIPRACFLLWVMSPMMVQAIVKDSVNQG